MASEFLRCAGYPAEHTDLDSSVHILGVLRTPSFLKFRYNFKGKLKCKEKKNPKPEVCLIFVQIVSSVMFL